MYVIYLAGGIGSGKSTVARWLEEHGCVRIDLDQLSREVLADGSDVVAELADAFGEDLVDERTGALNRGLLAARAFATPESCALLERIELPAIRALLVQRLSALAAEGAADCCVVEVPLLDRMGELRSLANEIVVVACPVEERRRRAIGRGMTGEDFDARAARQPSDAWLAAEADTLIDNSGDAEGLRTQLEAWFADHERRGWR